MPPCAQVIQFPEEKRVVVGVHSVMLSILLPTRQVHRSEKVVYGVIGETRGRLLPRSVMVGPPMVRRSAESPGARHSRRSGWGVSSAPTSYLYRAVLDTCLCGLFPFTYVNLL